MTSSEAKASAATLSPAMRTALVQLIRQVREGRETLQTAGIERRTVRALERRGFIRREHVRVWTERNRRSGRQHVLATWVTVWNVERAS